MNEREQARRAQTKQGRGGKWRPRPDKNDVKTSAAGVDRVDPQLLPKVTEAPEGGVGTKSDAGGIGFPQA